ncbi:MAG: cysteine desulfurase [Acidimicrobiia bacterium]|nr:cysteine desulfurase [Acidimicrobiia bacterium]
MLYLDNAATTPMRPEAVEALQSFADFGNPNGMHAISRAAKNAMEEAREQAAALIGAARPTEIVFTGGGTEADNLAVTGAYLARPGGVVVGATEHKAVLESAKICERLGSDVIVTDHIAEAVGPDTTLVSMMLVNNETGAVLPVDQVVEAVKSINPETLVHTDAVQGMLSEDINVTVLGVDMLSLAAHKFGGPKGVGLLYVRDGTDLEPVIRGGGQEMGRRSGTQNPMGIVSMVAAMAAAVADRAAFRERVGAIRDTFEFELASRIPDLEPTTPDSRTPQHAHLRLPNTISETTLILMDQAGLCAAAGSACQSGAIEVSHVLKAMGWEKRAAGEAVRFSFGWQSEMEDATRAAKIVADVWERAQL